MPTARRMVPSDGVRAYKNVNVAAIPAKRIVKATAVTEEMDLATAVGDVILGVTMAAVPPGLYGDVQSEKKGIVTSGAAIVAGVRLTTDAAGKAITSSPGAGVNHGFLGIAKSAASAIDQDVEVELAGEGETFQG